MMSGFVLQELDWDATKDTNAAQCRQLGEASRKYIYNVEIMRHKAGIVRVKNTLDVRLP